MEVLAQQRQINNLEEIVNDHPAHRFGDSRKLKKYRKRIIDVEQEINMRKKLLEDKENHNWRTFTDLIKIRLPSLIYGSALVISSDNFSAACFSKIFKSLLSSLRRFFNFS